MPDYDEVLDRQIGLYLSLKFLLGLAEKKRLRPLQGTKDSDRASFLQSTIFILKFLGIDLGFVFNWRSTGPFSGNLEKDSHFVLTSTGLKEKSRIAKKSESYSLSAAPELIIEKYVDFLDRNRSLLEPNYLNLLASVLFIEEYLKSKRARGKNAVLGYLNRYTRADKPEPKLFEEVVGFTEEIKEMKSFSPA